MRTYQVIWERIKKDKRVVLRVKPGFVKRVKKAVSKEKNMDEGFKFRNSHDHFYLVSAYDKEKQELSFLLKQSVGILGPDEEL